MKTVKIAICDDEKGVRDILRQKIDKHCKNSEFICQIYDLETGDGLLALPDEKIPDILFWISRCLAKTGCRPPENCVVKIRI